jgi:glutathione S-transferase
MATSLKLYVDNPWISPYTFSAIVALHEKGLAFDAIGLDLDKGEHKQGAYGRQSLTGKIPCLVDQDLWLPESSAIVEYLEEKYPAPGYARLLPQDLAARAKARMVMAFVRSDMMALREERPTTTMFFEKATKPLSAAGLAAAEKVQAFTLEVLPKGKNQLFDTWSIADADLAFMLQRLLMNDHKVDARIGDFVEAQWSRPSVKAFAAKERSRGN